MKGPGKALLLTHDFTASGWDGMGPEIRVCLFCPPKWFIFFWISGWHSSLLRWSWCVSALKMLFECFTISFQILLKNKFNFIIFLNVLTIGSHCKALGFLSCSLCWHIIFHLLITRMLVFADTDQRPLMWPHYAQSATMSILTVFFGTRMRDIFRLSRKMPRVDCQFGTATNKWNYLQSTYIYRSLFKVMMTSHFIWFVSFRPEPHPGAVQPPLNHAYLSWSKVYGSHRGAVGCILLQQIAKKLSCTAPSRCYPQFNHRSNDHLWKFRCSEPNIDGWLSDVYIRRPLDSGGGSLAVWPPEPK